MSLEANEADTLSAKMSKAPDGAFCIFAERVWAFEPCSTNAAA